MLRSIPWMLAVALAIPVSAVCWLGIRIIQQDRELDQKRRREGLEVAAGRLALAIEGRLREIEQRLSGSGGIHLTAAGPRGGSLLYTVEGISGGAALTAAIAEGERIEFEEQDLAAAATAYRNVMRSPYDTVRASALVRLGRVLRRNGQATAASEVYNQLLNTGNVSIDGQPSALLALQARCRMREEAGDHAGLKTAAADLATRLYAGGWAIDRGTFEMYRAMLQQWGAPPSSAEAIARTEAALSLWREWRAGELESSGRRMMREGGVGVLALWHGRQLWVATPRDLEAELRRIWEQRSLAVSLDAPDGQPVLGSPREGAVVLTPGETRLPFLLRVSWAAGAADIPTVSNRLTLAGLLIAIVLMLAAGWGLHRVTARELALARQQSDFVSAVSHEFRTPLTSLRHLTDLLVSGSVPGEERKTQYYQLLSQETGRLHRMVESLLSFGRMEAEAYAWRFEQIDVTGLVRGVTAEFREEPLAAGRDIDFAAGQEALEFRGDPEALSRAVWNLLENAAKYSGPETAIRVKVQREGNSVRVSIEDRGPGIPPAEQTKIFERFVRGAGATRAGVRGVGIGLSLVKRIAAAHGGSVSLSSEPGQGSTFTLVFPCSES